MLACPLMARRYNPAMSERILGVDPGTKILGYGIVEAGNGAIAAGEYGVVKASSKAEIGERLHTIHKGLTEVLARTSPDVLALETAYQGINPRTAIRMGEARGMVLLAAAEAGVPVVEYEAPKAKKAVTGNGRATKEQVATMVARILHLDEPPQSTDAADGLALAICHAHRRQIP